MARVKVTEKTVYTFTELSDSSKEKARDKVREMEMESFEPDYVLEDAETIAGILGIEISQRTFHTVGGGTGTEPKIHYSGFSSQGDGASFEGRYRYAKGAGKAIRSHAPKDTELHRIADELTRIQKRAWYHVVVDVGHMDFMDVSTDDNGNELSEKQFSPNDYQAVCELLRNFADWIYKQLEHEWEYRLSNEQIEETIAANEWEFDENGRIA